MKYEHMWYDMRNEMSLWYEMANMKTDVKYMSKEMLCEWKWTEKRICVHNNVFFQANISVNTDVKCYGCMMLTCFENIDKT